MNTGLLAGKESLRKQKKILPLESHTKTFGVYGEVVSGDNVGMKKALADFWVRCQEIT